MSVKSKVEKKNWLANFLWNDSINPLENAVQNIS